MLEKAQLKRSSLREFLKHSTTATATDSGFSFSISYSVPLSRFHKVQNLAPIFLKYHPSSVLDTESDGFTLERVVGIAGDEIYKVFEQ